MKINKVLVTNDDGHNSFGIKLLTDILKNFVNEIYVVAPKKNMSGSSRSISLREEIKFKKITSTSWIVDGTPTDCVIFALNHIFKNDKPDYIFSGINAGTNIGDEISYSGTVGAAFEGALRGIPSLAISQMINNRDDNYTISNNSNWFASVSHGFSTPTTGETLLPEGVFNPDIKAMRGWNFEMGTRVHTTNKKVSGSVRGCFKRREV